MNLDFFVLQSSTGAGMALSRFLAAHPQISLPDRDRSDEAFRARTEAALVGDPEGSCRGLMLHDRVQLEAGVPERVHALTRAGATFIQLVRDPYDVMLASHRRYVLAEVTSSVAQQLGRPPVPGAQGRVRSPDEVYDWLQDRLFYFRQGSRFAPGFDRWRVLDAADLWPQQVWRTMARVFWWLGVDESFQSELFSKDFHGFATKMLHFSQQILQVGGVELLVRLERTPHVPVAPGDFTVELGRVASVSDRVPFPLEATDLSLVTPRREWEAFSSSFRTAVSASIPAFLAEDFVPEWIAQVTAIHGHCEALGIDRLPADLWARMSDDLADDLGELYDMAPRLRESWQLAGPVSAASGPCPRPALVASQPDRAP